MSNTWWFDFLPSIVTLTLGWHMGNMSSAHSLVEVNISAKFEENPSIGIGFIERTRKHVKIKKYFLSQFLTLKCDLDLMPTKG